MTRFNPRRLGVRIVVETLSGETYPAAMFRESPTVPCGIEIMCNATQKWLYVREQKADFDRIVTQGGTFHEVEHAFAN